MIRHTPVRSFALASVCALLAVAGASARATTSAKVVPPPPRAYVLPAYERVVLPNGLTVLLLEKHEVPLASATLLLRSGSVADPIGKEGTASLTAALLAKARRLERQSRSPATPTPSACCTAQAQRWIPPLSASIF